MIRGLQPGGKPPSKTTVLPANPPEVLKTQDEGDVLSAGTEDATQNATTPEEPPQKRRTDKADLRRPARRPGSRTALGDRSLKKLTRVPKDDSVILDDRLAALAAAYGDDMTKSLPLDLFKRQ